MRFADITLTQAQIDNVSAIIGGECDTYKAVKGMQLVSLTVYKGSSIWDTVGITPDLAIADIELQL